MDEDVDEDVDGDMDGDMDGDVYEESEKDDLQRSQ